MHTVAKFELLIIDSHMWAEKEVRIRYPLLELAMKPNTNSDYIPEIRRDASTTFYFKEVCLRQKLSSKHICNYCLIGVFVGNSLRHAYVKFI